jgi:release factor glutamine methyltransferase
LTVVQAYEKGVRLLIASGFDRNEACSLARIVLDRATGLRHAHLMRPDAVLHADARAALSSSLHELRAGRPLPYILGQWEFFGLPFRCDERVLIPRPETETLVEAALERLEGKGAVRIADLGTGSGCIAVSLAHALPNATVYATDASPQALQLARDNAILNGVAHRVEFVAGVVGNWADPLLRHELDGMFDAVLSNPPYIAVAEIEALQPQIRDHEPRMALDGGGDGLDCYRQIAAQCGPLLAPDGFLATELGDSQFDAARAIFTAAGWTVASSHLDLSGRARVLVAARNESAAFAS